MIYSDKIIALTITRLGSAQQEYVEQEVNNEILEQKLSLMTNYKDSFNACSKLYHICISRISELEKELYLYEEQQRFMSDQYYLDRLVYKIKYYDDQRVLYKKMAEDLYKNLKEIK